MIDPTDPEYGATYAIRRGDAAVPDRFVATADWIERQFGIRPLNLWLDRILPQQIWRLQVIFEFAAQAERFRDAEGFNFDAEKQAAISEFFTTYDAAFAPTKDLFVCFSKFDSVARWDINSTVTRRHLTELNAAAQADGFWRFEPAFEATILFTFTDAEAAIRRPLREHFAAVKQYRQRIAELDEFGYFAREPFVIAIDSKETLDRDYAGSMYYYLR